MDGKVAAEVLELLAQGLSLRKASEQAGTTPWSVLRWKDENDSHSQQYASARATGYDVEFEDLDTLVAEQPPSTAAGSTDAGWVAWKRLQVDTKKWALSKKQPKKYGDKLDLNHSGGFEVTAIERRIVDPTVK